MTRNDLHSLAIAIYTTVGGIGLVLWALPVDDTVRAGVGAGAFLVGLFLSSLLKTAPPTPPAPGP